MIVPRAEASPAEAQDQDPLLYVNGPAFVTVGQRPFAGARPIRFCYQTLIDEIEWGSYLKRSVSI